MISIMANTTMTDCSVAACPLGFSLRGIGLSAALPIRERGERATQAPAVAVTAQAQAYAFAAKGAGGLAVTGQKTQHHTMWAFRGLEPWSDPA